MAILISSLISLAALGLLFGLGLAFASKKLAVYRDPIIDQIEEVLPSANCGACGYAGCEAYARAVVANKAKPTLCLPGKASGVSEKIKEILENSGKS